VFVEVYEGKGNAWGRFQIRRFMDTILRPVRFPSTPSRISSAASGIDGARPLISPGDGKGLRPSGRIRPRRRCTLPQHMDRPVQHRRSKI
jgi:hypothetical protein